MLIYYIIFGITILFALIDIYKPFKDKESVKVFWGIIALIVLFKGLRWDTGTDFPQYLACFENVTWSNFYHFERYGFGTHLMEPGYTFLNVLIKTVFFDYTMFLLITNFAIMWIYGCTILKYVPKYKFVCLSLVLVSTILFPVRQTFAAAIFLYSIRYILVKDWKKYYLCILIAFSFHRSAVLLSLMYPLMNLKFNYKRNIAIYIGLIVFSNYMYSVFDILKNSALNVIMGDVMNQYDATNDNNILNETNENNNILTYISSIVQITVYYWAFVKLKKIDIKSINYDFYNAMLNAYFFNLCLWSISYIPGFGSMNRMPAFFEFGYPFCIVLAMLYFTRVNHIKLGVLLFIATFIIKYNALNLNYKPERYESNIYVPYKTFLQRDEPMRSGIWLY